MESAGTSCRNPYQQMEFIHLHKQRTPQAAMESAGTSGSNPYQQWSLFTCTNKDEDRQQWSQLELTQ
eukprot:3467297-Lingulodinium_polyedra.AAC.1